MRPVERRRSDPGGRQSGFVGRLVTSLVSQEADTYTLSRRICPDSGVLRPVKDYTTRRIRTVFGTVSVRNPRWMLCRNCHPGFALAFAPLQEICPDRATPKLTELTARLGSMMPYRQAASVMAEFLPIEPTETHATVRKRTIRAGERLDRQAAEEERSASSQVKDRRQLELELPGDRRREFVISVDTAHVRSADRNQAATSNWSWPDAVVGGRGEVGRHYIVTARTDQDASRDCYSQVGMSPLSKVEMSPFAAAEAGRFERGRFGVERDGAGMGRRVAAADARRVAAGSRG
jgi:hypothetical protein